MKRIVLLAFVVTALCFTAIAQQKPWSQWDKKQAEKMLGSSPWAQTQSETFSGQLTVQMGTPEPNQAITYNYRIRLFSAKPIREAYARTVMLANPKLQPSQLDNFVNGDYSESIVVAVVWDGFDRRLTAPIQQELNSLTTALLKNKAYLERADGKRIWIEEYAPPSTDGTGAKFVFPRMLDGKPFVAAGDEFLRFVTVLEKAADINWRFKLADMKYGGVLEY